LRLGKKEKRKKKKEKHASHSASHRNSSFASQEMDTSRTMAKSCLVTIPEDIQQVPGGIRSSGWLEQKGMVIYLISY